MRNTLNWWRVCLLRSLSYLQKLTLWATRKLKEWAKLIPVLGNEAPCVNIRGLGQKGRRSQLVEMVHKYQVEGVCLQETLKKNFTDRELANLCRGLQFNWSWIPTSGHSGGASSWGQGGQFGGD